MAPARSACRAMGDPSFDVRPVEDKCSVRPGARLARSRGRRLEYHVHDPCHKRGPGCCVERMLRRTPPFRTRSRRAQRSSQWRLGLDGRDSRTLGPNDHAPPAKSRARVNVSPWTPYAASAEIGRSSRGSKGRTSALESTRQTRFALERRGSFAQRAALWSTPMIMRKSSSGRGTALSTPVGLPRRQAGRKFASSSRGSSGPRAPPEVPQLCCRTLSIRRQQPLSVHRSPTRACAGRIVSAGRCRDVGAAGNVFRAGQTVVALIPRNGSTGFRNA